MPTQRMFGNWRRWKRSSRSLLPSTASSLSMLVELQADNPDGKLSGGAYARVDFQLPQNPNMMRIPATTLMPVNRGVQIAVVGDDKKAVLKSIQLGRDFGDSVEVTTGLT